MTTKLDKKFKKAWVTKLRSGKVTQCRQRCVIGRFKGKSLKIESCCALGVAALVLAQEKLLKLEHSEYGDIKLVDTKYRMVTEHDNMGRRHRVREYHIRVCYIPQQAAKAVKLADEVQTVVTRLNDNEGKSFSEIADYIEANL